MKSKIIIIASLIVICLNGCKKLVEIDSPATSVSSNNIYNNDATAVGALTSLYVAMVPASSIADPGTITSLSCIAGLSADELSLYGLAGSKILSAYYQNALSNQNGGTDYWNAIYAELYVINSALEGLTSSERLTPAVKQQLLGEAKFTRAFYYFYLINLYGDVPLVLGTDYKINALIKKSSKDQIYQQIITDLKEAKELLSDKYLAGDCKTAYPNGSEERMRPTKWAASALLARCYLYLNRPGDAEAEASVLINNTSQFRLVGIDQVFLKNNQESIWQLQPTNRQLNTPDGKTFILPEAGPGFENPVYLNGDLVSSFEVDDQRKINWINSLALNGTTYYYPYKYKITGSTDPSMILTEYSVVMRLAEQYLIRSEARALQGNLGGAISDIDEIRGRAGIKLLKQVRPNINKEDLMAEILKERRLELFTEWGHRWLDMKRTGQIDEVMTLATPKKANGASWLNYQQNYPISLQQLFANPNLTPTPGY